MGAGADVELVEGVGDVCLDGAARYVQNSADVAVGLTSGDKAGDGELARRQDADRAVLFGRIDLLDVGQSFGRLLSGEPVDEPAGGDWGTAWRGDDDPGAGPASCAVVEPHAERGCRGGGGERSVVLTQRGGVSVESVGGSQG